MPPLDPPSLLAVGAVGGRVPHPEPGGRLDRQAGDRGASVVRATCGLGPRGRGARVRRCAPWWAAPLPGGQPLRHTDAGLQRFRRRRPRMSMAIENVALLAIEKCTLSGSSREGSEATGAGLPFAHDRTWSERGHFYCAERGHFTTAVRHEGQRTDICPMEWTPPPGGIAMCQDGIERSCRTI